jgi:hypothetical protein
MTSIKFVEPKAPDWSPGRYKFESETKAKNESQRHGPLQTLWLGGGFYQWAVGAADHFM